MSHSVYLMEDPPVIVFKVSEDYDSDSEMGAAISEVMGLLEAGEGLVYHIADMSSMPEISINEIIDGANRTSRGPNPVLHHPRIEKVIYVTNHTVLKLAIKGMESEAFGKLRALVVDTMDDALVCIREDMSKSS